MALTYEYKVPEQYGGKSFDQIRNEGANLGRPDILASFFGLKPDQPLTAGQTLTYNQPGENLADIKNSAEYKGITSLFGPGQAPGTIQTNDFNQQQRDTFQEYIDRLYGTGDELEAVRQSLGIPEAYQTYGAAGTTARDIAARVEDLPGTLAEEARGKDVSANQLERMIASQVQGLQPSLTAATRGLESSGATLQNLLSQYNVETQNIFKPYDIEAGLLGQQAKNEYDLLKTNISADLSRELAQLDRQTQLDTNEMNRLISMAEIEAGKGDLVNLGDRVAYVVDGKEVSSFGVGLTPTSGSTGSGLGTISQQQSSIQQES